jgi:hypothetical protein
MHFQVLVDGDLGAYESNSVVNKNSPSSPGGGCQVRLGPGPAYETRWNLPDWRPNAGGTIASPLRQRQL